MPNPFELAARALPNCQFPGGDAMPRDTEKAQALFATLTAGSTEEQLNRLRLLKRMELLTWESLQGQSNNHKNLRDLYIAWGNTLPNQEVGRAIVATAASTTLAFINKSYLLPARFKDFSTTLVEMQEYDAPTIQFFAAEA